MTAPAAPAAPAPWTARQLRLLAVLLVVGAAGLVAGYVGTSGTLRVSRQVVWINVAGAALVVSGAGVMVFLTAARRAVGLRRLGLFGDLPADPVADAGADAAPAAVPAGSGAAVDLVSAPAMTRYHRADCPFVAGKGALRAAPAADHRRDGKLPCGICRPGGAP